MQRNTPEAAFQFGSKLCSLVELRDHLDRIRGICSRKRPGMQKLVNGEEVSVLCGCYASGDAAEYVIMLCRHLKLAEETRYRAIEILSRFMSTLITQLYVVIHKKQMTENCHSESNRSKERGHISSDFETGSVLSAADRDNHMGWITSAGGESRSVKKEWMETLEHVKSQMKLRAVTAIMIASKVAGHKHFMTLDRAVDILAEQKLIYSRNVILKSELRILNTIKYHLRLLDSPYPCAMVLLEILCRTDDRFDAKIIHDICLDLLDLFYYFRPAVLAGLSELAVLKTGCPQLDNQEKAVVFLNNCYDLLKVCGALVSAAVYIHNRDLSDVAITTLCDIVGTSEEKLLHDCCVILRVLLQREF